MTLTALQTFVAIVDTGSLVRASEQLNVTQSTVTARLRTLEETVGQQLLNRAKTGATLTPAGTRLLRYARTMTGLWRQAVNETALPDGLASVCTIGSDRELWHGHGHTFFDGVVNGQPDIAVSARQGSGPELETWLMEGAVDVILTFQTGVQGGQTLYSLPPEDLVLYSDRADTAIDADPRYIFVDHGPHFRRQHDEAYAHAGVARISFDSSWWALQCLLERGGSAYLPRALAGSYVADGKLHELGTAPVFQRKSHIVVNDSAAANWPWFAPLIDTLELRGSQFQKA